MKQKYFKEAPTIIKEFLGYMGNIKGRSGLSVDEYYRDLRTFFRFMLKEKNESYNDTDINDIDILTAIAKAGGIAACPPNAMPAVRAIPGVRVLAHRGGDGAIRELCDEILEKI